MTELKENVGMSVLSADAVKKLAAVRDAILAKPRLYDQGSYYDDKNACGGACCLAGWLVWNDSPERFVEYVESGYIGWSFAAMRLLNVYSSTYNLLFSTGVSWEKPFGDRLYHARNAKQRARVAADYINFLIERDGPARA